MLVVCLFVIQRKTRSDKIILWQEALNILNLNKIAKLIRTNLSMSRLSLYGNSNVSIQSGDKIDLGIKLKLKEVVTPLQFMIISMCAFAMILSLSEDYTSLEPTIVLAQELKEASINENSIVQNNINNVTQLPTILANDKSKTSNSSGNETVTKDDANFKNEWKEEW